MLVAAFCFIVLVGATLYLFFRTNLGTAMRATGDNPQMNRALGVSVDFILILGLALSNGLIGLAGALLAQYQGFADVQMGIGMVVWGLASVIIGESLVGSQRVGLHIVGAVMGSILFRLLVAIALLLSHVVRWNFQAVEGLYRELFAGDLADRLDEMAVNACLPRRLRDLGIPEAALPALAGEAAGQWTGRFNPRPFGVEGALEIYRRAY